MKKIFINDNPWQMRVIITVDGRIQNIYFDAHTQNNLERAFFKGVVVKVLPGIQTAFVDIGQERAGFLHISEIDRDLAIERLTKNAQLDDDGTPQQPAPVSRNARKCDIASLLKDGETILVQVCKEPVYEKGAKLTTCFTLPGRFIVLMPTIGRIGVSKKIEDRDERVRLKTIVRSHLPEGMGCIIRTTSEGRADAEIIRDINALVTTWLAIVKKNQEAAPKALIHEDVDLAFQTIRDHLDGDVEEIIIDNPPMQEMLYKFIKKNAPEFLNRIRTYTGKINIFKFYDLEKQISEALNKKIELKSGGSLIIETTQAMTVVDVNTGRFVGKTNMEETVLKTNLEAAEETVRQLRLQNIGGLIVIDFIDMNLPANRQKLFRHLEKTLQDKDKFQSVVLKVSEFGLVEMTRKRSGKTLVQQLMQDCHTCRGSGHVKSIQTEAYAAMRNIKDDLVHRSSGTNPISIALSRPVFDYITTTEYNAVLDLEKRSQGKIVLVKDLHLVGSDYKIEK